MATDSDNFRALTRPHSRDADGAPGKGGFARLPTAASALRWGLVIWGAGHIRMGDRRGWLLVGLQPLSIGAVALVAVQLIDGTRWLIVFPPLAALLAAWLGQAVHAYRRAVELGARPGGEMQAVLFLPLAVTVLTLYWLAGGRSGTPAATLEGYVLAWMSGRLASAAPLHVAPPTETQLATSWSAHDTYLGQRVATLAGTFGAASGLDPNDPFDSLRFGEPLADGPGRQVVNIEIVRRRRVEAMVLGVIPTATQETIAVERAGSVTLALVEQPTLAWLPFGRLQSFAWRVESVAIGPP